MSYRISLPRLFNEDLDRIKETDDAVAIKRVTQNIKKTAQSIERLERSGLTVHDMIMRNKVPNTRYIVVYKIRDDTKKVLIAKKILRHG